MLSETLRFEILLSEEQHSRQGVCLELRNLQRMSFKQR